MMIRIKLVIVIIMIFCFGLSSCDLLLLGGGDTKSGNNPGQQAAVPTETRISFLEATGTSLFTPTETEILLPTVSPTKRPTWTPYPTNTSRPTWTATEPPTTTATRDIVWIIKDNFSEDLGSWFVGDGGNWSMGYSNGGYFMAVSEKNVEITSTPTIKLADVRILVDIYRLNGKGYWGISCRETGGGSYYTLFITDEGKYGYGDTRNGAVALYILGTSEEIFTSKLKVNQIMGECRGNNLSMFINGEILFQVKVDRIGPGWAGMMVGSTNERDMVEVVFDNIEIWGPEN